MRNVVNALNQRFELLVGEGLVAIFVGQRDDHSLLLALSDLKRPVGQWRMKRCALGQLFEVGQQLVPRRRERLIPGSGQSTITLGMRIKTVRCAVETPIMISSEMKDFKERGYVGG